MYLKKSHVQYITLGLVACLSTQVKAELSLNDLFSTQQNCENALQNQSIQNQSIENTFLCGKISGRLNTLYYSTHDAFFVKNLNQDTVTTGGFIKYETAPFYGVQAGISFAGQRRLDDKNSTNDEVTELKNDKDGLGEAYLSWKNQDWNIRVGQQSLDAPFIGNYDWRVMPPLFQAADFKYGQKDDFIRGTYVRRFKSYADDEFFKTSSYSNQIETDGMWSIGLGKSFDLDHKKLTTQAWYQSYQDYANVAYVESHLQLNEMKYQPDFGVQMMYAQDQGDAKAGKVDHQGIGIALGLKLSPKITLKSGYNYTHPNKDSYLNGALFVPYMIYTSSGPYFAQPFFTSTQDLGAGHAVMLAVEGALSDQTFVGANYSLMNLAESDQVKNLNQSEYVVYGIYNFSGHLKGWSVFNFFGVSTSPRSDDSFVQNRLGLKYAF